MIRPRLTPRETNGRVVPRCEVDDPAMVPVWQVLESFWIADPVGLLTTVAARTGHSLEGVVAFDFVDETVTCFYFEMERNVEADAFVDLVYWFAQEGLAMAHARGQTVPDEERIRAQLPRGSTR